jgi:hypothetical protein
MDMSMLNRASWHVRFWTGRLTWPWLAAGTLVAFSTGFYLSMVVPARNELESMHRNLSAMQEEIRMAEHANARLTRLATPAQLEVFYKFFPSERSIPDWVEKINNMAAGNRLALSRGEYQVIRDSSSKLLLYQITLPVKGTYPHLRSFIDQVLKDVPFASIDNVKFERQKIGDEALVSTVMITLHLGRES